MDQYQLKNSFLEEWPLSRIKIMTLEEYTNLDKTSFCYWLEAKTPGLGSIWGGSAYKFGIYKRKDIDTIITVDNRVTDAEYAWYLKYGKTKKEAFEKVRSIIVEIIEFSQSDQLKKIDDVDLGNAIKWKIAFLYGNFNIVNIFKQESLLEAAQSIGYKEKNNSYSKLNRFLITKKEPSEDYFKFTEKLWSATALNNSVKYWLYAPGEDAHFWEEFYKEGIMGLGWDGLGDLNNYENKKEINQKLQELEDTTLSKKNDAAANFEFYQVIKPGDIVIAKKGRTELLGYGVVTSDYFYNEKRNTFQKCRNVDWKLKGNWKVDHDLALKTLTDITKYPSANPNYTKYYEALLGIMAGSTKGVINVKDKFIDWLVENTSGGNYFINQFNSNKDKLKKEIDNYEAIYKQHFNLELFIIDVKNYKNEIEIIKNNIYRKDSEFYEYASTHVSGRPKAILGNKNFLRFLNEYFTNQNIMEKGTKNNQIPLNQILYGPPGTGKTFNSINKALEIINEEEEKELNWEDRSAVKNLFDKRIDEGRVVFTTFHQSMSYEDFIEGIKPEEPEKEGDPVIYKIKYGILRDQCIEACFEIAQLREDDVTEEVLDFSFRYDKFVADTEEKLIAGEVVKLKIKKGATVLIDSISQNGNVLIKHVEGNRVYTVSKNRLTKLNSVIKDLNKINNIANEFKAIIGGSNSSAYWSVLNAIREQKFNLPINTEKRKYTFEDKKEVVLSLSKSDFKNKNGKPFVLIIDEINRGNVSQIFGELITLIEEDKRLGKTEALEVTLPYSNEKFGVPANLFIIGTMNTADRSVEALDAALRRRFCFEEMPPLYDLNELQNDIFGYKAFEILKTINSRIEKLIDKDHAIGHSYLLNKNENSIVDSFYKNIIPLLQEYFFGDYGKLGLVLGKGFVHLKESDKESDIFADFDDASNDFESRDVYEIIDYRKVADYKLLLNKVEVIMDFKKAIQVLMNKKVV